MREDRQYRGGRLAGLHLDRRSTAHDPKLRCLQLAWYGLRAGTLPIGAVVTDGTGTVVSEGRGRMLEPDGPPGQLADCPVAHAEINALAGLGAGREYADHTLYTSLEPCLMCVGAAGMARIGTIVYLGADPYAGASRLYRTTPYLAETPLSFRGPQPGPLGLLGMALHLAFYLHSDPDGGAMRLHRRREPAAVTLAGMVTRLERSNPEAGAAELFDLLDRAG
ncbi:MAG: nucleoside deaminase [Actinocatenispora sp.]